MKQTTHPTDAKLPVGALLTELRSISVKVAKNYEFYYVVEGKMNIHCNEKILRLKTGDMFMATPGQAFMVIPDYVPSLYIHLTIDPSFVQLGEKELHKKLPCLVEANKIRQVQLNLFYRIYEEVFQDNFDQIGELIEVFLQKLNWEEPASEEEIQSDRKVALIIKAAEIFEIEEPGLEDLAKHLDISPSYLSRVFKEVTGMRFSDFSQRKKLQHSSLLLLSGMSVEEIAKEVGFTSSKSLNRIYRQFIKTTPSTYRKYLLKLTEKKKEQKDLRLRCAFQNFSSHYSEPSYVNTMKEYLGADYNRHSLSITDPIIQDATLGQRAISLNNFSENYMEEIKLLREIGSDSMLALNLLIPREECGEIFFKDLNRQTNEEELFALLDLLNEMQTPVILALEVKGLSIKECCNKHQREELADYLKIIEAFYKKIIKHVTRPIAESYYYVFDTSAIMGLDTQKAVLYFFEFMEKYHLMLERLLYTLNYRSVYYLGKQHSYELENIIDFISKNRHRIRLPQYSNTQIILPQRLILREPHQLLGALKLYNEAIEELNAFEEDDRLKKTKIKLQGIEMRMELDFVDPLYIELFFSILTLDLWMKLKGKSRLVPNYNFIFQCRTKESAFTSWLIGRNGSPTPFYHINRFVSEMPQDVIYHKEGCLISKNEDEIHLLIYTNPLLDYAFSLEKGFEQLDDYKREVNISIEGASGRFKETTQIVNYKHGSPYFLLRNFSHPELMSDAEKAYVRSQSTPLLMTDYKEVGDSLDLTLVLSPFEVQYKTFKRRVFVK